MQNRFKNILEKILGKTYKHSFLLISFGLAITMACFHFWIAYPGYFNWDGNGFMMNRNNIQPVIPAYFFTFLFHMFGRHVWLGLLLLISPFYFGLWLISLGFYKKYKSWGALLCFFPVFIQTIFLQPFIIISTSFEAMYSFLLYAGLLYLILIPSSRIRWGLVFLIIFSYIFSLFSRHNGIVQIFPAIPFILCLNLRKTSKWEFLLKYTSLTFMIVIVSFVFKIVVTNALPSENLAKPHQHVLSNQLAAMCVPENDASCFDESWFIPGKSFEDMKRVHLLYPLIADACGFLSDDCGMSTAKIRAEGIEKKWLQAIFKYPQNYINHEIRLIKLLWTAPIHFVEYSPLGPKSPFYEKFNFDENNWRMEAFHLFPFDELYMHETPLKKKLLHIWDDYLPKPTTLFWIFYMLIVAITSSILLFFKKDNRALSYCFHLSWGGLVAAIVYGMFHPEPAWRYVQILWVFGICITYGIIVCLLDMIRGEINYE